MIELYNIEKSKLTQKKDEEQKTNLLTVDDAKAVKVEQAKESIKSAFEDTTEDTDSPNSKDQKQIQLPV